MDRALGGDRCGGHALWGTWGAVPFWLAYGLLDGSTPDARWHECVHGTAFRTPWMNDAVYLLASFMLMRNPVSWRWSHARHHTDTIIFGCDAEISVMRHANLARKALAFVWLPDALQHFAILLRNVAGRFGPDERDYIPETTCRARCSGRGFSWCSTSLPGPRRWSRGRLSRCC